MSKQTKTGVTRNGGTHEFTCVGKMLVWLGYAHRWFNCYTCDDPGCEGKLYRCWNGYKFYAEQPKEVRYFAD